MVDSSSYDVLNLIIDLSHLVVTDNYRSWQNFELIGLSGQDGLVYFAAYKQMSSEIGIFSGSYILPNSWRMISRFSLPHFKSIKWRFSEFSKDFAQIGFEFTGLLEESLALLNRGHAHKSFVTFDLSSALWEERYFRWPDFECVYNLSHSSVGWIIYPKIVSDHYFTIHRLSMDLTKNCVEVLLQFPPECYHNSTVYITYDLLYCFSNHPDRFMYICDLSLEGFPWERYAVDSGPDHFLFGELFITTKYMNDVPIFKVDICDGCPLGETCFSGQADRVDPDLYTVVVNSTTKCCRIEKIRQGSSPSVSKDIDVVFRRAMPGILNKSKLIALFDNCSRNGNQKASSLFLETLFFKPPTLKELCSLALMKTLCQKTCHVGKLRNSGSVSCLTWSGGPSEEIKNDLGLNNPTLHFGQLKP